MKKFITLTVVLTVAAIAYIAGTKAGRARYRAIQSAADAVWNDREVRKLRGRVDKRVRKAIKKLG